MSENTNTTNYVPSAEAITLKQLAEMVGRSYAAVYADIKKGYLDAHKFVGIAFVEPEDIPAYVKRCEAIERVRKELKA